MNGNRDQLVLPGLIVLLTGWFGFGSARHSPVSQPDTWWKFAFEFRGK